MDTRSDDALVVKRNLFFRIFWAFLWLTILYFISNLLIGGIVGFLAGMGAGSYSAGYIAGQKATIRFFQQYGLYVLCGQFLVFALLAFIEKLPGTTKYKRKKKSNVGKANKPKPLRSTLKPSPPNVRSYSVKKASILVGIAFCISIIIGTGVYSIQSYQRLLKNDESKPYQNESEWIMHSILTDIAAMGCYAKYLSDFSLDDISISFEKLSSGNSFAIRATAKLPRIPDAYQTTLFIESEQHIWSPEVYAGFARNTLKTLDINIGSPSGKQPTETYILQTLLNPDLETLQRENKRISKRLANDMLNSVHHSEAALLIGMFSLRESAGYFSDTRFGLNRMAAHLALAYALDSSSASDRLNHYSKIAQYLLLGEQKKAVDHIENKFTMGSDLSSPNVDVTWKNALKTRATNDWRILDSKHHLSLFEKMEYYRASCTSATVEYAVAWIKADEINQIPYIEASRVAATKGVSVTSGHMLLKNSIPTEIQNLLKIFPDYPISTDKDKLLSFLNLTPGGCINYDFEGAFALNVISDGLWGAHFQRHLSSRIEREHLFYRKNLGSPNKANEFLSKAEELLGEMYLFPVLVRLHTKKSSAYLESMKIISVTLTHQPQLINAWAWSWMDIPVGFQNKPSGLPNLNKWFVPGLPQGTIYHSIVRYYGIKKLRARMHKDHQWIMQRAPYKAWYRFENAEHLGKSKKLTADELLQIYGPLAEYSYSAMFRVAEVLKSENKDRYISLSRARFKIVLA